MLLFRRSVLAVSKRACAWVGWVGAFAFLRPQRSGDGQVCRTWHHPAFRSWVKIWSHAPTAFV
jgi:hypothetical protein